MAIISQIKRLVYPDVVGQKMPFPPRINTGQYGGFFRVTKRWDLHGRYFIEYRLGLLGDRSEVEIAKGTFDLLPIGARFHAIGTEFADAPPAFPSRMELERS